MEIIEKQLFLIWHWYLYKLVYYRELMNNARNLSLNYLQQKYWIETNNSGKLFQLISALAEKFLSFFRDNKKASLLIKNLHHISQLLQLVKLWYLIKFTHLQLVGWNWFRKKKVLPNKRSCFDYFSVAINKKNVWIFSVKFFIYFQKAKSEINKMIIKLLLLRHHFEEVAQLIC